MSRFYKSVKFTKYWKLFGIKNEISLKVGELDAWELKDSIRSGGIVLYGKYISDVKAKPYHLFELKIKGSRKDKIRTWRKLYGYAQEVNKKTYKNKGLITELRGKKIGKAAFVIPSEHSPKIVKYLKDNKIDYLIRQIYGNL